MKEVLISIKPKLCELIANGKKTIEVRKTRPKIDPPFKCYIYCTKAKDYFSVGNLVYACSDELYRLPTGEIKFGDSFELAANWDKHYDKNNFLNEKVIGEFVCYKCNNVLALCKFWIDEDVLKKSCLTLKQIEDYSNGSDKLYGWNISELKIYDNPKDLSSFGIKHPPKSWCYVEKAEE